MGNWNLWIFPAKKEEKGSFCDITSQVNYHNTSQSGAEDQEESAMRAGGGIAAPHGDSSDFPSDQRFNITETEVDSVGYDYPSKHGPKR